MPRPLTRRTAVAALAALARPPAPAAAQPAIPVSAAVPALVARFDRPAAAESWLVLSRLTLEPGATLVVPATAATKPTLLSVETGGPASFRPDGRWTLLLPGDLGSEAMRSGFAEFGPLAGVAVEPSTGYRLRNGGQTPLVLLSVALDPLPPGTSAATPEVPAPDVLAEALGTAGPLRTGPRGAEIELRRETAASLGDPPRVGPGGLQWVLAVAGSAGETRWTAVSVTYRSVEPPSPSFSPSPAQPRGTEGEKGLAGESYPPRAAANRSPTASQSTVFHHASR